MGTVEQQSRNKYYCYTCKRFFWTVTPMDHSNGPKCCPYQIGKKKHGFEYVETEERGE